MIISFAWTTPAVVLGMKTVTRRDWSERTIRQYQNLVGQIVDAWDKSPRFDGRIFGTVRILEVTPNEDSRTIPDSEWEAEGFHVLSTLGAKIGKSSPAEVWRFWKEENDEPQTVVRFELVSLNDYGCELKRKALAEFEGRCGGRVVSLAEAMAE